MTAEGLQGFLLLVALTQGLLPLGLKLFGADSGPIWCVAARLDGATGWIVAAGAVVVSAIAIVVIEERA